MLILVDELEMLVLGNVPVESAGRKATNVRAWIMEIIVQPVIVVGRWICQVSHAALQRSLGMYGGIYNAQTLSDPGIDSTGESTCCGYGKQVFSAEHLSGYAGDVDTT